MATYNDLEKRIDALEEQFNGIIISLNNNKEYTDADIDGCRQSIGNITPYTDTKTAYYGEKEKTFYGVPQGGNVTVIFDNYKGDYSVSRIMDRVMVSFDTLIDSTQITISVL